MPGRSRKGHDLYFVVNSLFLIRAAGVKEKLPVDERRVRDAAHHRQEAEHLQAETQSHCWAPASSPARENSETMLFSLPRFPRACPGEGDMSCK